MVICFTFSVAMTKTFIPILLFSCAMFLNKLYAQQPAYTYYTQRDGLPSNDIYNCVEDKKGFLWIATENGLSKFDGKKFTNYYTTQGLPDNDILSVQMDTAGVIWVLPFQKTPAYYDEKNDRFINSSTDKELSKIFFGNLNNCYPQNNGGIAFCNNKGQFFIYKNKRCRSLLIANAQPSSTNRLIEMEDNFQVIVSQDSIRKIKNNKVVHAEALHIYYRQSVYTNNTLYITDSQKLHKIQILANGNMGKRTLLTLPFEIRGLNFTGKQLALSSINGNIYFADTASLVFSQQAFSFNSLIRYVFEDKAGNTWICTKENGLIRYQQKGILSLMDGGYQRNFNTVSFLNNAIVAGTNDGQIFLHSGAYNNNILFLKATKNYASWIRKMVPVKNGLYVGAEGGLFFLGNDLKKKELFNNATNIASKDFLVVDDSILFAGNSGMVSEVSLPSLKINEVMKIRVTALEAVSAKELYVGSNTGLYKYQKQKPVLNFANYFPLLSTRVSALAYNKMDSILWIGLATDSLVAMQSDSSIFRIPLGLKLPGNNCKSLFTSKKGTVWVGTNTALGRINYSFKNGKMFYKIAVFTTADGIAGKQINDIAERNDTIYVATTGGISMLPSNLRFNVQEIPVYITKIKINNIDTTLLSQYDLGYKQNDISVEFSAADLAATTERIYQYKINDGEWIMSNIENIVLQQLAPGNYNVAIRALKRDGSPSNKAVEISFKIRAPFWKTPIFTIFIFVGLLLAIIYFLQKRNKIKREQAVQKLLTARRLGDLELRALKAQINPHFVFNCLNSIKYLNHQQRFNETALYLDKFSYLLRKTLDYSGLQKISLQDELVFSKNYLELEKLRLGTKMMYEIIIEQGIDVNEVLVPPLLMQPYLENGIKHGIRHLMNRQGEIRIEIKMDKHKIICLIKDNGTGLQQNAKQELSTNELQPPHGLTLQQRRAQLYDVDVKIMNGENGMGTTVILTL